MAEIGVGAIYASRVDKEGEVISQSDVRFGSFNPNTQELVLADFVHLDSGFDYILMNKTGQNLYCAGTVTSLENLSVITGATASGVSGKSDVVVTGHTGELSDLIPIGSSIYNDGVLIGIVKGLADSTITLSTTLGATLTVVAEDLSVSYTKVDVEAADNYGWLMLDNGDITIGATIKVSDGVFFQEFTSSNTSLNSNATEYKGIHRYNREVSYNDLDATLTLSECVFSRKLLNYVNGYDGTDLLEDATMSIVDNPYLSCGGASDVRLIGIRAQTEDCTLGELMLWNRVKGSGFTFNSSKTEFSVSEQTLNCMAKSSGDASCFTVFYE